MLMTYITIVIIRLYKKPLQFMFFKLLVLKVNNWKLQTGDWKEVFNLKGLAMDVLAWII